MILIVFRERSPPKFVCTTFQKEKTSTHITGISSMFSGFVSNRLNLSTVKHSQFGEQYIKCPIFKRSKCLLAK